MRIYTISNPGGNLKSAIVAAVCNAGYLPIQTDNVVIGDGRVYIGIDNKDKVISVFGTNNTELLAEITINLHGLGFKTAEDANLPTPRDVYDGQSIDPKLILGRVPVDIIIRVDKPEEETHDKDEVPGGQEERPKRKRRKKNN